MFYNIFLRPINLLSFFSTVLCHSNLLLPILFLRMQLKTPSIHVILGLPLLLLPGRTHSNTFLGNLLFNLQKIHYVYQMSPAM